MIQSDHSFLEHYWGNTYFTLNTYLGYWVIGYLLNVIILSSFAEAVYLPNNTK